MRGAASEITPWDALSGQYYLRPGSQHSVVGQRPVLGAGRLSGLLRGQRGSEVSRTLSSVFTLCAHAHRRTAEKALAAAQAEPQELLATDPPALHWIETARDHLRSMALDWPQRLPQAWASAPRMDWLRDCPLTLATTRPSMDAGATYQALAQLRSWLENRILGQSVTVWLAIHRDPVALARWCHANAEQLPPAHCLSVWHPVAQILTPAMRCLDVLDEDVVRQGVQLRLLAQTLVKEPEFAQRPTWLGQCAENGPWSRLRHRVGRLAQAPTQHSAWTRMSARWMELMEIAAAEPRNARHPNLPLLASGALDLGEGQALAWCEMARGLLLHWVQLDAHGAVQDYRVLAPTEWNFHPEGVLARAVTALPVGDAVAAQALAAAFDPCVACSVQSGVTAKLPSA